MEFIRIAACLAGHEVTRARQIGWHELENGELQAEQAGYELLLTTDKNIRYQQNLTGRKISTVVLGNSQWPIVRLYLNIIAWLDVNLSNAANCSLRRGV